MPRITWGTSSNTNTTYLFDSVGPFSTPPFRTHEPKFKMGQKVFLSPKSDYYQYNNGQLPADRAGVITSIKTPILDESEHNYGVEWPCLYSNSIGINTAKYRQNDLLSTKEYKKSRNKKDYIFPEFLQ